MKVKFTAGKKLPKSNDPIPDTPIVEDEYV
jgi:hypothetical protein